MELNKCHSVLSAMHYVDVEILRRVSNTSIYMRFAVQYYIHICSQVKLVQLITHVSTSRRESFIQA